MPRGSRQAILEAAKTEFAEHGFAGGRVNRIARRAGLNKQLLYYYFGSKAALHAAATGHGERDAMPRAAGHPAEIESLRKAVLEVSARLAARPEIVALLVDPSPASQAAVQAHAWIDHTVETFRQVVSAGQGAGYVRDDVDPKRVARQATVLCVGFLAMAKHWDIASDDWVRDVGDTLTRATAW